MFNFFSKSVIGLDISDHSIKMVSLSGRLESPRLSALGRVILEPDVVKGGSVFDKGKLKDSLIKIMKNPNVGRIKTKKIFFSAPELKSFAYTFKIPEGIGKQEQISFIKSKARQTFPYPLEELYLDFTVNGEEALVSAAPKALINSFLGVFRNCGLRTLAVGIESESIARSLIEGREKSGIVMIIDIGIKITNINVFDGGKLRLSDSIEVAGNEFTQMISKKLNISTEEAEKAKKEAGLNPDSGQGKIFLILQNEIQKIIQEIEIANLYFKEREAKKIEKIILTGGSSALPYFVEYLSDNLDIPVAVGNPWININIDILKEKRNLKRDGGVNPGLYAAATGSALMGFSKNSNEKGINLIKNI